MERKAHSVLCVRLLRHSEGARAAAEQPFPAEEGR